MGNLAEGLIFKGLRHTPASFQQSYPQKIWTPPKALKNQALTVNFEKIDKP
jgi:hypothetical protein